ncbi:MAG: hypothetical protein HN427_05215 [Flavobacteriales bacterium]|nr:hypothetical protein [Flavobacteriales bacterium]
MKKIIILSLSVFLFTSLSFAQNIEISDNTLNIIKEDFNSSENEFPILTTIDNYFIVDNGDYLLSRNNTESEYAILANTTNLVSDFRLRTSIRLGPSSDKRSSAGIILKAQQKDNRAIIIEINRKSEYRIKELQFDQTYKFLIGKMSDRGWVKSNLLKGEDEYNSIEVRCEKNVYDLYVNNSFLTSFFVPNFKEGKMGIFISPNCKARIAYYYLDAIEVNTVNHIEEQQSDKKLINLTNKISQLESENIVLQNNNDRLSADITKLTKELSSGIRTEDFESLSMENTSLNSEVNKLKSSLESVKSELDKGEKMIREFSDVRTELSTKITVSEKENSSLSSKISEIKNKIKSLETSKKELTTEVKNLNTTSSSLKSKISKLNSDIERLKNSSSEKLTTSEKNLNNKISSLTKEKKVLTAKLNTEEASHKKTKDKLKITTTDKTSEITKLSDKLVTLQRKLKVINARINNSENLKSSVDALKKELSKKDASIATLVEKINKLDSEINTLQNNNNKLVNAVKLKNTEVSNLKFTIEERDEKIEKMKKVFIYKGFDENGIDSEKVKTTRTNAPKPKVITNKNEIYSVQIAVYGNKINMAQFDGLSDVFFVESEYETFLYMSGQFTNPNEATVHKIKLIKKGYKDAFVVQLNNK